MKSVKIHLSIVVAALFFLSGCYTSFKTITPEESVESQTVHIIEDGWYEMDGAYYYIDYSTREWYNSYGINLSTERYIQKMIAHGYHPPATSYFYSPILMRALSSINLPIYNNQYIVPGVYHPPYYSNQYLYSFFYDRWAQWYYWDSERPNSWCYNPYQLSAFYGSNLPCGDEASTSIAANNQDYANERNRELRDGIDRLTDNRLRTPRERLAQRDENKRGGETSYRGERNSNVLNAIANLPEDIRSRASNRLRTPRTEILRERIDNLNVEPLTTNQYRLSPRERIKIDYWQKLADGRVSMRSYRNSGYYSPSSSSSSRSGRSTVNRTRSGSSHSGTVNSGSSRTRTGSSASRENSSTSRERGNNR